MGLFLVTLKTSDQTALLSLIRSVSAHHQKPGIVCKGPQPVPEVAETA